MRSTPGAAKPGDPTSAALLEAIAPFVPTRLNCEIVVALRPRVLSKVWKGETASEAPKVTLAIKVPAALKMFTPSLVVLKPRPEPV